MDNLQPKTTLDQRDSPSQTLLAKLINLHWVITAHLQNLLNFKSNNTNTCEQNLNTIRLK